MEQPQEVKPRRISLSEIVDRMLSKSSGGRRSGVTIGRTAAGETTLEVSVNIGDDEQSQTLEEAGNRAAAEYERLRALYPLRPSHQPAEVSLTRNAKGETQIGLSVKASDDAPSIRTVGAAAQKEYDRLRTAYPMASGATAAAGSVKE